MKKADIAALSLPSTLLVSTRVGSVGLISERADSSFWASRPNAAAVEGSGGEGGEDFKFLTGCVKIRCFCYTLRLRMQSNRVSINAFVKSYIYIYIFVMTRSIRLNFIMTRVTTAACNHCGAPMPPRKATTSLSLLTMALLRAVSPELQASG